jgi:hypothetical protein
VYALGGKARLDLGQRDVVVLSQHRHNPLRMHVGLRRALIAIGLACNARPCLRANWRQRIAVATPTRKRAAAARQLMPSSVAATTRSRKS